MSDFLLGFPNKKERDDFLIALVVILFFGWLMLRFIGCDTETATLPDPIPSVEAVVEDAPKDRDGDGISDADDRCPNIVGVVENRGCPADRDGDGVYDTEDKCPNVAGAASNDGCPILKDSDGDGIADKEDNCPDLKGIAQNSGCPPDADGDGVYDHEDNCPRKWGKRTNNGCPEIRLEKAEAALIAEATQAVEFETGSAKLKRNSLVILNKIVGLLKKYPKYKVDIVGHTDNVGNPKDNLLLSENRAKACYDYLLQNGIDAERMLHFGKGETAPITTNDTELGRSENRRVEFKLHY